MMINVVFILCACVSVFSSVALMRAFLLRRNRLLLWCAISFGLLAVSNIFLCVDLIVFPNVDMSGPFWRHILNSTAGMILLLGLIGELA